MDEHTLEKIISSFDQEKLPAIKSADEQDYAQLVQILKTAGQKDLAPDSEFINSLEVKLLKGGEPFMFTWFEKLLAKPWLLTGLGLVVLFVVSSSVQLPFLPMALNQTSYDVAESSVSSAGPGFSMPSSRSSAGMATRDAKMMVAPEIAPMPPIYGGGVGDGSSIVRNANLDLEVKDVSKTASEVNTHVESIGGMVTNSSVNKMKEGYSAYLNLRVPASQFQATIQYLKGLAIEIVSENVSAYDQSPQVSNTDDQLEQLRQELTKYQTLLAQATTTEEKLNLQSQIARVEREIRDWERQSQNLENNEQFSYISLSLREKSFSIPVLEEIGLGQTVEEAVEALKRFALWLVVLGVWAVVFSPVWLPIYLLIRRKNKK